MSFVSHKSVVMPWQCDRLDHMNTRYYQSRFDEAGLALFTAIAGPLSAIEADGRGWADVKQTIDFLAEVRDGDVLTITSTIARIGTTSITHRHVLTRNDDAAPAALHEVVTVYFDLAARRAAELPAALRTRFVAVYELDI